MTAQRAEIERIAISLGVSAQVAGLISAEWDQRTRQRWARCDVYIAARSSSHEEVKQKALQAVRRSGRVAEAASEYGISRATMYRLLKK